MTVPLDVDAMRVEGRRSTGVWGAAAGAGVVGIVLAYFLYAYLYLSVSSEQWPPAPIADPPLLRPAALLGLSMVGAAISLWAARSRPPDDAHTSAFALTAVAASGVVFVLAGFLVVADLDLDATAHAYGAIVTTVHAVHGATTLVGVAIATLAAFEAHRLGSHPWVAAATVVTSIWWCTVTAGWVAIYAVVYAWPQLS